MRIVQSVKVNIHGTVVTVLRAILRQSRVIFYQPILSRRIDNHTPSQPLRPLLPKVRDNSRISYSSAHSLETVLCAYCTPSSVFDEIPLFPFPHSFPHAAPVAADFLKINGLTSNTKQISKNSSAIIRRSPLKILEIVSAGMPVC